MHSEGFAAEQHQIDFIEPWLDEPSEQSELALARSGLESAYKSSRLEKLPKGPFRSIGGYLNYAGWADCQRFMDLDRAIRLHTHQSQNTKGGANSHDCPTESYPENLDYITADCQEHSTELPSGALIIGLEDLPVRRL